MSNFPTYYVWALNKERNAILSAEQNGIKYDSNSLSSMMKLADTAIACGQYDKAFVIKAEHIYFTSDKIHDEDQKRKNIIGVFSDILKNTFSRETQK